MAEEILNDYSVIHSGDIIGLDIDGLVMRICVDFIKFYFFFRRVFYLCLPWKSQYLVVMKPSPISGCLKQKPAKIKIGENLTYLEWIFQDVLL